VGHGPPQAAPGRGVAVSSFPGHPTETTDSPKWFVDALTVQETGVKYIWDHFTARTGWLNIASKVVELARKRELYSCVYRDAIRTVGK
jgi:hypothetical protein